MASNVIDLPADIVVVIVNELKKADDRYRYHIYPFEGSSSYRNLGLDWLASTQFCKGWRQAAMDCASLWSDIDVTNWSDSMIEEFLSRSRDSPLSLAIVLPMLESGHQGRALDTEYVPFQHRYANTSRHVLFQHRYANTSRHMPKRLARCLENLYRTRELAVTIVSHLTWSYQILKVLQLADTPLLEHFALDGYAVRFNGPVSFDGLPFNNFTPRLRSLALRSVALPCDSSVLRPSSSLLLELVVCHGGQSLDDILKHCSSLSMVAIDSVKVVSKEGDQQTLVPIGRQPILMPRLKSITLCGSTELCNSLTLICRYPSNATSSWAYMLIDEDDALPTFPVSNLSGHIKACVQVQKKSLMEVQWGSTGPNEMCSFGMQRTVVNNERDTLWSFASLCKILDGAVQTVDSFTLYIELGYNEHSLSSWKALLQSLRGLRQATIRFKWGLDMQFFEAFGGRDTPVLPDLTDLTLMFDGHYLYQEIIDALKSGLSNWKAFSGLENLRLKLLLIGVKGEPRLEEQLVDLQPLVCTVEVDSREESEADKIVDPMSFRIYRRMSRYGRKTEFRK